MVIYFKKFEDFKSLVDKLNMVVFYRKTERVESTEEEPERYDLTLYVSDDNIYGYDMGELYTKEQIDKLFLNFEEVIEIDSIE